MRISPLDILKFDGFRAQKREILRSRWIPTPPYLDVGPYHQHVQFAGFSKDFSKYDAALPALRHAGFDPVSRNLR